MYAKTREAIIKGLDIIMVDNGNVIHWSLNKIKTKALPRQV